MNCRQKNSVILFLFLLAIISAFFNLSCNSQDKQQYEQQNKQRDKQNVQTGEYPKNSLDVLNKYKNDERFLVHFANGVHYLGNDSLTLVILNFALENFPNKKLKYGESIFLEDIAGLYYKLVKDNNQLEEINQKLERVAILFSKVNIWEEGRAFMLLARAAADAGHFKTAESFASRMKISDIGHTYGYIAAAASRAADFDTALKLTKKTFPDFARMNVLNIILKQMVKTNDVRKDSIFSEIKKIYDNDPENFKDKMCRALAYTNKDSQILKLINESTSLEKHDLIFSYITAKNDLHDLNSVLDLFEKYQSLLTKGEQQRIMGDLTLLFAENKDFNKTKEFCSKGVPDAIKYEAASIFLEQGEINNALQLIDLLNEKDGGSFEFIRLLLDKDKINEAHSVFEKITEELYKSSAKLFIANWYDKHNELSQAFNDYQEAIKMTVDIDQKIRQRVLDSYIIFIEASSNPWKDQLFKEIEKMRN